MYLVYSEWKLYIITEEENVVYSHTHHLASKVTKSHPLKRPSSLSGMETKTQRLLLSNQRNRYTADKELTDTISTVNKAGIFW